MRIGVTAEWVSRERRLSSIFAKGPKTLKGFRWTHHSEDDPPIRARRGVGNLLVSWTMKNGRHLETKFNAQA